MNISVAAFGGNRTPEQAILDVTDLADDAQLAVVVILGKDDLIHTSWSDGSLIARIGMLEIAKKHMITRAYEGENRSHE